MIQALFICCFLVVLAIVELAFVDCLITRPSRWGWWLLFILMGYCPMAIDLATGQFTIAPISVQIVAVCIGRDISGGTVRWLLQFSLPVGAMLWLRKSLISGRRRTIREREMQLS